MKYRYTNVPSLIQGDVPTEKQYCAICGRSPCDFHHLLTSSEKKFAEDVGAWVWLCRSHHSMIHNTRGGRAIWLEWKEQAQAEYERTHTRGEWMKGAHRNYIR